ncbi:concanavalin A-like lectin/glucanase [Atractiella rhizophila]|nr:concanavalin A-like lectin/glucanase [Atractiella rhizophila]
MILLSLPLFLLLLLVSPSPSEAKKKKSTERTWDDFSDEERAKTPFKGTVERTMALRTHSIYAPYVDSDLQNRWFDFGGSSIVNTNKHIRLTQEKSSQQGYLWSRLPVTGQNFMIEVEFRVDGKGNSLFGDGFAIWLTKERTGFGPVFGSRDKWTGLGLFFDTYANSRHDYTFPIVMGMHNDGTKNYNVGRDGFNQEEKAAICQSEFRRTEITAKARITYVKNKFLQVDIQAKNWDQWDHCFTIWGYEMIPGPYLGFSAHTGQISDNHDIISVSAHNVVYHEDPSSPSPNMPNRFKNAGGGEKSGSGFFTFLSWMAKILFLLVGIVVCLILVKGYMEGQKKQKSKQTKKF